MASIKFSGIGVTDIRGMLGGTVFGRSAAGANIRRNAKPISRDTTASSSVQSKMSLVSQSWKSLTDAQKAAWNSFAAAGYLERKNKMGETVTLSGFQAFLEINLNRVTVSQSVLSSPVSPPAFNLYSPLYVEELAQNSIVLSFSLEDSDDYRTILSASPGQRQGASIPATLRVIGQYQASSPLDQLTLYVSRFGVPLLNSVIFFSADVIHTASGFRYSVGLASGIVAS